MKKVLSVMLCMALLFPLCGSISPSQAAEIPEGTAVSTVEEFENMSTTGVYYLASDIDFSGKTYSKNVYTKSFKGVLDGNGHALTGITIDAKNSDAGIFATSFGGTLKNLTIGAPEKPASITSTGDGYSVAAIAGTVTGGSSFENLTIYANVTGDGKTAAFTSYMPGGKLTISGCKVYGSVAGNPAAGFVTMSPDGSSEITITNSENHASVTGRNLSAGGFYTASAAVGSSRVCHLTITGCANYGAITASDWRVGGIVGEFNEQITSTLNISYCYNLGPVTMTGGGGFAGGIVGGMCFDAPSGERTVANVYNAGLVRNTANSTRAYGIAFAHSKNDKVTVTNAAYMEGIASENTNDTNVTAVADKAALLTAVKEYPSGGDKLYFAADTGNINDGYPILALQNPTHENVQNYTCGRSICLDCNTILSLPEAEKHSYQSTTTEPAGYLDGYVTSVCKYCSDTKITTHKANQWQVKPVDGVYSLSLPEHLMWYSANQNAGLLSGNETIRLAADLDMKDLPFTPIASVGKAYTGKFDGNGHTIRNLTVDLTPADLSSNGHAGLFAVVGMGAEIKNLVLDNATIKAVSTAGALVGMVAPASVVVLENLSVINSTVSSIEGVAGGLVGSSAGAADVTVLCAVCDGVSVSGTSAGGVLGNGNSSLLKNVFANAKLTATSGATGALAPHTAGFSANACGYSKSTAADQKDGTVYEDSAFASGEIAYLVNTFGARKVFGVEDGKTTLSDTPIKMIRLGSTKIYTNHALSAGEGTAVYALSTAQGMTLAIVQVQNAEERLVDSKITVDGKEIAFSDLTLCKYAPAGDDYYVAMEGAVMYTLPIDGTSAPAVVIGNSFNGTATTVGE